MIIMTALLLTLWVFSSFVIIVGIAVAIIAFAVLLVKIGRKGSCNE